MTAALTTPATPARPSILRQLRWLLRLHRPALLIWGTFALVTCAALVWLGGPLTDAAATAWTTERDCDITDCAYDPAALGRYSDFYTCTTFAVLAAPFLVAAWAGGWLTSRELESGTARLAWTQGVSPARWLAARLALPGLLVVSVTGLLAWLHHRAWTAGGDRIPAADAWYDYPTFYANGLLPVALGLAGLGVGAVAGLLLRRSTVSLATATIAVGVLWTAVHLALPHLWPTVTRVTSLEEGSSALGISTGEGVLTAGGDRRTTACRTILDGCHRDLEDLSAVHYFNDFHPPSHYWPLQLVASGVLLAVTALCVLAAFHLLRHHTGWVPRKADRS
ncbi:ABC transporter permease [Streptomyces coelicoflavus]|uniref:ABC transporter permease n=1 Tax=Streptomyces TaxID=1883 RepID=UPI001291834A|nr:ABC transporter permease [Streptomyces sp. SYP-A7193]QFX86722.1 ABC transporter permease [Streptomyces sp. SYP-A7193]